MEVSREELEYCGFVKLERKDYFERGFGDVYILAKKVGEEEYEVHGAQDAFGRWYDSSELDGLIENMDSINEVVHFLREPNREIAKNRL